MGPTAVVQVRFHCTLHRVIERVPFLAAASQHLEIGSQILISEYQKISDTYKNDSWNQISTIVKPPTILNLYFHHVELGVCNLALSCVIVVVILTAIPGNQF